jgi:hypothetical protein
LPRVDVNSGEGESGHKGRADRLICMAMAIYKMPMTTSALLFFPVQIL